MRPLHASVARFLVATILSPGPAITALEHAQPAASQTAARRSYVSTQLQGDERILHALDRLTFGARPGDAAAVRAKGLDQWFEEQLHPGAIDNSALDARLARFPAMQWSTRDLLFRAPANPVIRQAASGNIAIPQNGVLHAVYANAIYRMGTKKEARNENATPSQSAAAMQPSAAAGAAAAVPADPEAMALAAKMDALDDDNTGQTGSILALPPDQRVVKLISMQPAEFESFIQSLRPADRLKLVADLKPAQRETVEALQNPERLVGGELLSERLARDIYSDTQLAEVMTDFWLNHFSIYLRKNEMMPYYLVSYERDVIRPHALGKFEDLLEAVAHSPAMMVYLDNAESIGPDSPAAARAATAASRRPDAKRQAPQGLNENYARELMELHTLGVNGGYTQADVTEVARILTGWTIDKPLQGGDFTFNANRHEPGTKKVMGEKFKDDGEREGRALLHFLATRPATAQFLARKLAIRFVSDDPPQALVDRMAQAYLTSGGDIPAMLRALYRSPEFWATTNRDAKVKTPLEFVVSAARASNADVQNYEPLINALNQMGMPLYGCIPPSGWDWKESTWVSTGALAARMNFALALAANRFPGITTAWAGQSAGGDGAQTAPGVEPEEARLEAALLPGGASATTRAAALDQFQQQTANQPSAMPVSVARAANRNNARTTGPSPVEREDQMLAGLLLGSPEFQRR